MRRSPRVTKVCPICGDEFETPLNTWEKTFCSRRCMRVNNHAKMSSAGGKRSAESQKRRSKNEKFFAELCQASFSNVRLNERMFDGWDADVILKDHRLAILWDGPWHRRKITRAHSLEQVQTRDRLKRQAISNAGYSVMVIEDNGRFNKDFVKLQFQALVDKLSKAKFAG